MNVQNQSAGAAVERPAQMPPAAPKRLMNLCPVIILRPRGQRWGCWRDNRAHSLAGRIFVLWNPPEIGRPRETNFAIGDFDVPKTIALRRRLVILTQVQTCRLCGWSVGHLVGWRVVAMNCLALLSVVTKSFGLPGCITILVHSGGFCMSVLHVANGRMNAVNTFTNQDSV